MDVTKKVWQMLLAGKTKAEILEHCSISSYKKISAEFNKQKNSGSLTLVPEKFPQKSRSKSKDWVDNLDDGTFGAKKQDECEMNETGKILGIHGTEDDWKEQMSPRAKKIFNPPANYPRPGKPDCKVKENFEKGEKSYDIKSYEIKSLEELIAWADVDMDKFDCTSFVANRWGNAKWECTQCKATFKPKVRKGLTPEEAAEVFYKMVEDYKPPVYTPIKKNNSISGNIAESVAMDIHLGSLTRKEETGIDYNLDIARDTLLESTRFHLNFIGNFDPEKIVMPIGSDFFNVDTVNNTTTKGTFQSEDSTWKHTFDFGCRLMIASIDLHKRIAPVEVLVIIGNHDTQRSFALGAFLTAWYRNDPLVTINNDPTIRKYFSWGTTLIGLSHGEEKRGTNYLGLMNLEAREHCGTAVFKEFHLGHKHHLDVKEDLGFRVRGLGGLTATDEWHSKMGYGAIRESQAFIINRDSGIIAQSSFHPTDAI